MSRETIRLTKLDSGTYIRGTIEADADLRIDGQVEGVLKTSQKIFIGESGAFNGEAAADSMDICGHFKGTVHVKHKLFLGKSAYLEGDVNVGSIEIEDGAHFQGKSFMLGANSDSKDETKTKQLHPNQQNKKVNKPLKKAAL